MQWEVWGLIVWFDPFSKNNCGFSKTGRTQQRASKRRECLSAICSRKSIQSRFISHFVLTKLTLAHKSVTVLTSEALPLWGVQLFVAVPPSGPFLLVLHFQPNLFHMKLIYNLCESPLSRRAKLREIRSCCYEERRMPRMIVAAHTYRVNCVTLQSITHEIHLT